MDSWISYLPLVFLVGASIVFSITHKIVKTKRKIVEEEVIKLREQLANSVSLRKSSEVRLGKTAENLAPFIKDYPYDPYHFTFIGMPIDGIQINKDSLIVVEFKTGGARLTASQKHVKNLIKLGKVRFETFRIDENGTHLKIESDMEEQHEKNK